MKKKTEALEPVEFKNKIKCSYYLAKETEERLMELYIHRIKNGSRPRKSQLIDEAVLCLYNQEVGKKN